MKGVNSWSFRPYTELYKQERGVNPYICRLAPFAGGFELEFIDNGAPDAAHTLLLRVRGTEAFEKYPLEKNTFKLDGLEDLTDYELCVERADGKRSEVRLLRTGWVPGKVINYLHPEDPAYAFSGRYLCSPSILRLPSGRILASMDVHAGDTPQNLTLIFYSEDDGESWHYLTELFPCFWGKMFLADGKLYMLGCSNEYGDLLIGRSDDEGATWTMPTVLFRGAAHINECGLHRAPMPVEISHGRIMTDIQYGAWRKKNMTDGIVSAPIGCDLLDASNWTCSEFWDVHNHPDDPLIDGVIGGIEGNVVTGPDGEVYDILRYADGKSLKLRFDPENPEAEMTFAGLIDIPTTTSKCNILYDRQSGLYYALVSFLKEEPKTLRNLLSLVVSPDLEEWRLVKHLLDWSEDDPQKIAFQYVDFCFDGDDILYQSRTAFNEANSFHNNNYSTFHRIKNFREIEDFGDFVK